MLVIKRIMVASWKYRLDHPWLLMDINNEHRNRERDIKIAAEMIGLILFVVAVFCFAAALAADTIYWHIVNGGVLYSISLIGICGFFILAEDENEFHPFFSHVVPCILLLVPGVLTLHVYGAAAIEIVFVFVAFQILAMVLLGFMIPLVFRHYGKKWRYEAIKWLHQRSFGQ